MNLCNGIIHEMKRLYTFLSALIFIQRTELAKGYYGRCSPYDTFCLFSEGNENRVSNLSEAQLKCSEIKNDSWPVELGDERVKEVFIEFIHNYSISNVILSAFNRNGTWYWMKSNTSVQIIFNVKDNLIFYNNSGFYSDYSVVCMTDCWANWTDINQTQLIQPDAYYHLSIKTPEECKEYCEKDITCPSIEWTYAYPFHGCWIHKYPYDASKLIPSTTSSHHVIDRTIKSVKSCINEAFAPASSVQSHIDSTKVVEILVPIILIVIILVIVILIIFFYKKRTKRDDVSEDFGDYKAAENVRTSQPQLDGDKTSKNQCTSYYNLQKIQDEPKRYPGPRGDQYTEADTMNKQASIDGSVDYNKHDIY